MFIQDVDKVSRRQFKFESSPLAHLNYVLRSEVPFKTRFVILLIRFASSLLNFEPLSARPGEFLTTPLVPETPSSQISIIDVKNHRGYYSSSVSYFTSFMTLCSAHLTFP